MGKYADIIGHEQIIHHLKSLGYGYITLDLEGFRSGSMDEPLLKQRIKD